MKIILVIGARPNFMKIAPVVSAIKRFNKNKQTREPSIQYSLIHTGQHYDKEMSDVFFTELELSKPQIYLGVGSGTHAEQTGKIMMAFEDVCQEERPDLVVVVGDVNSTLACALVAAKLCIPVAHVEAGLRSFDRSMPEEINRILTDQVSDFLFTTCEDANRNLKKEGIAEDKIYFVGNVMIDTLMRFANTAKRSDILRRLGLEEDRRTRKYALLTLHRPSNVDEPLVLGGILSVLDRLTEDVPVIFPAHPRTVERIRRFDLESMVTFGEDGRIPDIKALHTNVFIIPPLGYVDFLGLMANAAVVLTDSGGIQEETTILGVPCLTLRNNTERPVTVREGTNVVVGNDPDRILLKALHVLENGLPQRGMPRLWDGKAAERIVKVLVDRLLK